MWGRPGGTAIVSEVIILVFAWLKSLRKEIAQFSADMQVVKWVRQ